MQHLIINRWGLVGLFVLGVGCGVSNSLMTVGIHLWGIYALVILTSVWQSTKKDQVFLLGLAYALSTLVALFFKVPLASAWGEFGAWILFFYWVIAFAQKPLVFGGDGLKRLEITVGVAYVVLWGICLYHRHYLEWDRVQGVHNNPNRLACALLPAMIYFGERLLVGAYRLRSRPWVFLFVVWILIFHMSLMTGTRSIFPFVVLYAGSLVWRVLRNSNRTVPKKYLALGSIAGLVVFAVLIGFSGTAARFNLSNIASDGNVLSRLEFWRINLEMFRDSPILGTGFRQNLLNVADHPGLAKYMPIEGRSFLAHSTYVQVLTESGILGFLLFFGFLMLAFWKRPHLRWFVFSILLVGIADTSIHLARTMPAMIFFASLMGLAINQKNLRADGDLEFRSGP